MEICAVANIVSDICTVSQLQVCDEDVAQQKQYIDDFMQSEQMEQAVERHRSRAASIPGSVPK